MSAMGLSSLGICSMAPLSAFCNPELERKWLEVFGKNLNMKGDIAPSKLNIDNQDASLITFLKKFEVVKKYPLDTELAVKRYEKFMNLLADNNVKDLAPTMDIELVLRTHWILSTSYKKYILETKAKSAPDGLHWDDISLHTRQNKTSQLWQEAYGEPIEPGYKCWQSYRGMSTPAIYQENSKNTGCFLFFK